MSEVILDRTDSMVANGVSWQMRHNGYAGLMVRAETEPVAAQSNDYINALAARILAAPLEPADATFFSALMADPDPEPPATCTECNGTRTVECKECQGEGETTCFCLDCDNTHQAECDDCDGDGMVDCPCAPKPAPQPVRISGLDGTWDRRLITPVLRGLNATLCIEIGSLRGGELVLRAGDTYGIVLPLRHEGDAPLVIIPRLGVTA